MPEVEDSVPEVKDSVPEVSMGKGKGKGKPKPNPPWSGNLLQEFNRLGQIPTLD